MQAGGHEPELDAVDVLAAFWVRVVISGGRLSRLAAAKANTVLRSAGRSKKRPLHFTSTTQSVLRCPISRPTTSASNPFSQRAK